MSETLEKILRKHGIKGNEIDLGELLELLAKAHGWIWRQKMNKVYVAMMALSFLSLG